MVDAIYILQKRPEFGAVRHISAREENVRVEAIRITSGQVIQASYLMALSDQAVGEGRAKKAGSTGNKKIHR
jgi:hypothetical protein